MCNFSFIHYYCNALFLICFRCVKRGMYPLSFWCTLMFIFGCWTTNLWVTCISYSQHSMSCSVTHCKVWVQSATAAGNDKKESNLLTFLALLDQEILLCQSEECYTWWFMRELVQQRAKTSEQTKQQSDLFFLALWHTGNVLKFLSPALFQPFSYFREKNQGGQVFLVH